MTATGTAMHGHLLERSEMLGWGLRFAHKMKLKIVGKVTTNQEVSWFCLLEQFDQFSLGLLCCGCFLAEENRTMRCACKRLPHRGQLYSL
eukprot:3645143-Amphidinium_carterae.1